MHNRLSISDDQLQIAQAHPQMFKHLSSSELTCFTSAVELGTKIRDNVKSIINKLGDYGCR